MNLEHENWLLNSTRISFVVKAMHVSFVKNLRECVLTVIKDTSSFITLVLFQSFQDFFGDRRRSRNMVTNGHETVLVSCISIKNVNNVTLIVEKIF